MSVTRKAMSMVVKALIKTTGNPLTQSLLERVSLSSHFLMGIGCGGGVASSGEAAVLHALKKTKQSPYCIFDVGANKGQFLQLVLTSLATDDFTVHCFEPSRDAFAYLRDFADKNARIALNNVALSSAKGGATLHYDAAGSVLASLTKRKLDHFGIDFGKSEEVVVDTVDSYCASNLVDHIHLLKLDVEGHELDVLSGAKEMFAKKSIGIVTFEFGGCNIDTRTFFQDFWFFFSEANFTLFRIAPSGYLRKLESYREAYEQFETTNFMAVANR